jgi:ElaB/YqjD/DUF883 family membrane-anchored ribosome-binding protein
MAEKSTELTNMDDRDLDLDTISTSRNDGDNVDLSDAEGSYELSADESPEDTDQIKAQIEQTRSQMGETIDAIQERLSFSNISEQVSETVNSAIETAKDTAYDATIGKAVSFMKNVGDGVSQSGAFRSMKNNPLPFALIGLGAGLLAYQSYSGKGSRRGDGRMYRKNFYGDQSREASYARTGSADRGLGDKASRAMEGVSSTANSALESVSSSAGAAYDSVTGAVTNAYSGAEDFAYRAYDRAGEFGNRAYEKYDQYLEQNPLALGAVAVAVGAAVGFSIPSTTYEGEVMGEARENLMSRVQDAAGSLVDKAKQVASEAGQTIKEETRTLTQ